MISFAILRPYREGLHLELNQFLISKMYTSRVSLTSSNAIPLQTIKTSKEGCVEANLSIGERKTSKRNKTETKTFCKRKNNRRLILESSLQDVVSVRIRHQNNRSLSTKMIS